MCLNSDFGTGSNLHVRVWLELQVVVVGSSLDLRLGSWFWNGSRGKLHVCSCLLSIRLSIQFLLVRARSLDVWVWNYIYCSSPKPCRFLALLQIEFVSSIEDVARMRRVALGQDMDFSLGSFCVWARIRFLFEAEIYMLAARPKLGLLVGRVRIVRASLGLKCAFGFDFARLVSWAR